MSCDTSRHSASSKSFNESVRLELPALKALGVAAVLAFAMCACANAPSPADPAEEKKPKPATTADDQNFQFETSSTDCSDQSCFTCGKDFCLPGSICTIDSNSRAGSCIWLKECGQQPSCDCVLAALGESCSCENGVIGPIISCS